MYFSTPDAAVHARRQPLAEAEDDVHERELGELRRELARQAGDLERQAQALLGELEVVRAQQRAEVDVAERRRHLLVDDPHHLLGRDAVRAQRGDERAGRGADVDVELVDRAVDAQQVQRAEGADLVDRAREAAAAQDEGGLGPAGTTARRSGALLRPAFVDSDDLAHAPESSLAAADPRHRDFRHPVVSCRACASAPPLAALSFLLLGLLWGPSPAPPPASTPSAPGWRGSSAPRAASAAPTRAICRATGRAPSSSRSARTGRASPPRSRSSSSPPRRCCASGRPAR